MTFSLVQLSLVVFGYLFFLFAAAYVQFLKLLLYVNEAGFLSAGYIILRFMFCL